MMFVHGLLSIYNETHFIKHNNLISGEHNILTNHLLNILKFVKVIYSSDEYLNIQLSIVDYCKILKMLHKQWLN
jgi:hypothetical protein